MANWSPASSVLPQLFADVPSNPPALPPGTALGGVPGQKRHEVDYEILGDDMTSKGLKFSDEHVHIVCPWHGYEYNLQTGRHPGNKNVRLKPYKVKVDRGDVYVVV